jgi:TPP-dependent pyruvate/acetoin dehydrogenase alpha subunit
MTEIDAKTCLSLYRMGRLIRRTQEILMEEYVAKQEMRCPMHFCVGQEGAPTALTGLLRPEDHVVSHYRSHGYYLVKGGPLPEMIAEFHGKMTGSNHGTAGSMELAQEDAHFYSGAIVGGPLAIAMGIAFALKYRDAPGLVLSVVGDGSFDEGISYEALNLAALYNVPLLAICENNLYAAHTPEATRTNSRSLAERVRPFGMRTERFDGYDIPGLHTRLRGVIEDIRSGSGPCFVEIETYRFCGHVGPENDEWLDYRKPEEVASWRARDPIPRLRTEALRLGVAETTLAQAESQIEKDIEAAFAAARRDAFPDLGWSLDLAWSNTYSPVVKKFWQASDANFDSHQAETRPKPY